MKFIAMNRFKIITGREKEFEDIWRNRETYLSTVSGFIEFHLLRGEEFEDFTLYSSHSLWNSKSDFVAWTKSEQFKKAHKGAGSHKSIYLGHPQFEGFEILEEISESSR